MLVDDVGGLHVEVQPVAPVEVAEHRDQLQPELGRVGDTERAGPRPARDGGAGSISSTTAGAVRPGTSNPRTRCGCARVATSTPSCSTAATASGSSRRSSRSSLMTTRQSRSRPRRRRCRAAGRGRAGPTARSREKQLTGATGSRTAGGRRGTRVRSSDHGSRGARPRPRRASTTPVDVRQDAGSWVVTTTVRSGGPRGGRRASGARTRGPGRWWLRRAPAPGCPEQRPGQREPRRCPPESSGRVGRPGCRSRPAGP